MTELAEANREHFNASAAQYDDEPWKRALSEQMGTALLERKDWAGVRWHRPDEVGGREVKLLDYACGTGAVTRAYGPHVTKVVGIDVSENMVQRYNEEAVAAGLKPEQVRAVVGNLFTDEVPAELKTAELYNFDVVVVGLGFHHFDNPLLAIKRLTERLKPQTGVLMLIDFLPFENDGETSSTITHAGFERANLLKLHEAAKLQKFSFSVVDEPAVLELQQGTRKRKMFVTRAMAPPTAWNKLANWVYDWQLVAADQLKLQPENKVPEKLGITGQVTNTSKDTWHRELKDKFK